MNKSDTDKLASLILNYFYIPIGPGARLLALIVCFGVLLYVCK